MSKFIPFVLALAISLGPTPSRSHLIEQATLSTVKVTAIKADNQTRVCTGIVINSALGWVLTAEHCLGDDLQVDGVSSSIVRSNDALAIISMPVMIKPPLELGKEPQVGDEVIALGWGYDEFIALIRHVARIAEGHHVKTDNPFVPGTSGGPVIDSAGKLVGIVQASNERIGLACGVDEIRAFLKRK